MLESIIISILSAILVVYIKQLLDKYCIDKTRKKLHKKRVRNELLLQKQKDKEYDEWYSKTFYVRFWTDVLSRYSDVIPKGEDDGN